jgi:hypothetical protein
VSWGTLVIALIIPPAASTVRQAFKLIKKAITNKIAAQGYKLAVSQNKELKKRKAGIMGSIAKALSQ